MQRRMDELRLYSSSVNPALSFVLAFHLLIQEAPAQNINLNAIPPRSSRDIFLRCSQSIPVWETPKLPRGAPSGAKRVRGSVGRGAFRGREFSVCHSGLFLSVAGTSIFPGGAFPGKGKVIPSRENRSSGCLRGES